MDNILKYIVIYFFYSAVGWFIESLYCSIGEKRIINRGFLTGPMCPIYGTGALVMLFNAKWWDYTYEFCNIKSRVCLKHTLYWGIASVSFVYVIHPGVDSILVRLDPTTMRIVTGIILAVFVVDVTHSVIKAMDIRKLQTKAQKMHHKL